VNEPPRVHPADGARKSDGDDQTVGHSHGTIEPSLERLATRILEHQLKSTLAPNKLDRPNRPIRFEVRAESVFMLEAMEGRSGGMFVRTANEKYGFQPIAEAAMQRELTFPQARELVGR
jgi:hypothetical protein